LLPSVAKRVLQLAENLRFAKHHRVEATGDAEDVLYGLLIVFRKQGISKAVIQPAIVMQPLFQSRTTAVLTDDVKLGAVAGRQQDRFIHPIQGSQALKGPRDFVSGKDELLAYFERCRVMVQTEYLQRHTFINGAQRALEKIEVRMISELNGEFLVCLEADSNIFVPAKRFFRDRF
jgi:hypothetical protein